MDMQALVDARLSRYALGAQLQQDLKSRKDYLLTHFTRLALPRDSARFLSKQDLSLALCERFGPEDASVKDTKIFAFSYEDLLVLATCAPGRTDWRVKEERDIPPVHKLRAYSYPWSPGPWPRMCMDLHRALGLPLPLLDDFPADKLAPLRAWICETDQHLLEAHVSCGVGRRARI